MRAIRRFVVALGILLAMVSRADAVFVNGGFESGDFTGWTQEPVGADPSLWNVVTSAVAYDTTTFTAKEGSYFAVLTAGADFADPTVYTTVSQTVSGVSSFAGWAAFDGWDELPFNDDAYVRIYSGSTLIATPWVADIATVGNYLSSPWTAWSWSGTAGDYTLEYGVRNAEDNSNPSRAFFDLQAVPEPSTLLLLVTGLTCTLLLRRTTLS